MIKVSCEVKTLRDNGDHRPVGEDCIIEVQSHWNNDRLVHLVLDDGRKMTVSARDLTVAIDNATRTAGR